MIKHALIGAAIAVGASLNTCEFTTQATGGPVAPATVEASAATAAVGAAAPAFTLNDQNGKPVSLADFAGKTVVLEWINPDCPFVQRHYKAKTFSTLADKYRGKDVVWLAINTTKYATAADNAKWIASNGLSYAILDDHTGAVGRLYGAKTTPHMFVIDPKGVVQYAGAIDDDPQGGKPQPANYVDAALADVLAGKPVATPQTKPYGCSVKYAD